MEAGSGDRPPRPPPPQQPPTAPLEVDGSTPSTGRRRRLLGPSMQTLAGATMEDLQGDLPIQAKLQASLGSDFATLPGGDRLPDEEDAERGEDSSGHGNGRLESEMEEEEPDLSPVRTLPDLEAGEAGAAGDDLDATRTRGRCHPSSAPSPTPALPGVAPAAAAAAAPAPPLFPPVSGHGFAAHHAHAFVPPALATTTPLSSSSSSSKQLHQVPLPPSVGAGTAAAAAAVAAAAVAPPTGRRKELGTRHVLMTSAETMWGVLIFLRFGWCVGNVGLVPTLGAVLLSAACQALCASSLSAVATNGLVTRSGGAYFMVVKALGMGPGASVGFFYWLGMTALMCVEVYGFAEGAELLVRYRYHHVGEEHNPEPHVGEPPFTGQSSVYWDRVLLCFICLTFLLGVRLLMRRHTRHKIISCAVAIFFTSLFSCSGGVLAALAGVWRPHGVAAAGYPRPSARVLWGNLLLPDHHTVSYKEFRNVLSVVYPSFIGIFQGSNLCSELKNPFQAIPRGTFGSLAASCVLYTLVFVVTAVTAPGAVLRDDTEVLLRYAWPSPLFGYAGTMAVGLISALSCFEVSPRILQNLAEDRAIRILTDWDLNKLYSWGYRGQVPVRAILLTGVLAAPFLFLPSIELIARATAVCFLTMYTSMNLACLLQSALQLHTWRPAFYFYSWVSALLGTLACLFLSFYLDGLISLFIFALAGVLFVYIEAKADVTTFGHGIRGLKYHVALTSLYGMEESLTANAILGDKSPFWRLRRRYGAAPSTAASAGKGPAGTPTVADGPAPPARPAAASGGYWRPQILVYLPASDFIATPGSHGGTDAGNGHDCSRRRQLLSFVGQLKASRGLTIGATVLEEPNLLEDIRRSRSLMALHAGSPAAAAQSLASLLGAEQEKVAAVKKEIMGSLAREGILGFAEVVSAPDLRAGLSSLLQLTGLGGLRPNTCVLAWPDARRLSSERALRFLEFIARAAVNEKAVLALKTWGPRFQPFPASNHVLHGHPLDVWWLLHDGGILILVAYLLKRHATWRHCSLRIFTVVQGGEREALKTQVELTHYLHELRIRAEVHVVGLAVQEMGAYGGEDWTVRRRRTEGPDTARSLAAVFAQTSTEGAAQPQQPSMSAQPSMAGLGGAAAHLDEGSKIQRAIVEHSRESALVLINLPPPPKSAWVDPMPYFRLVEHLTGELQRVILVYGSGVECLSKYL